MEKKRRILYIPSNIRLEKEVFKGVGNKELIIIGVVTGGTAFLCFILVKLSIMEVIWATMLSLLAGCATYSLLSKGFYRNMCILDYILVTYRFFRHQQRYEYRYRR